MNENHLMSSPSARDDWRAAMLPCAEAIARDELVDLVQCPGHWLREDFIVHCAELECVLTPKQYVDGLRTINAGVWSDRVTDVLRDFASGGSAA